MFSRSKPLKPVKPSALHESVDLVQSSRKRRVLKINAPPITKSPDDQRASFSRITCHSSISEFAMDEKLNAFQTNLAPTDISFAEGQTQTGDQDPQMISKAKLNRSTRTRQSQRECYQSLPIKLYSNRYLSSNQRPMTTTQNQNTSFFKNRQNKAINCTFRPTTGFSFSSKKIVQSQKKYNYSQINSKERSRQVQFTHQRTQNCNLKTAGQFNTLNHNSNIFSPQYQQQRQPQQLEQYQSRLMAPFQKVKKAREKLEMQKADGQLLSDIDSFIKGSSLYNSIL